MQLVLTISYSFFVMICDPLKWDITVIALSFSIKIESNDFLNENYSFCALL